MMMAAVLQAFLLVKIVHGQCSGCGQLPVTQTFTGVINNNVVISGNDCFVVNGAQISGSVEVSGGARLVVQNSATISGSVLASGALTSVSLKSVTTNGDVSMNGTGPLCVEGGATTGSLKVEDISGGVTVEGGTVSSVEVSLSTGDIALVGATVLGGVSGTNERDDREAMKSPCLLVEEGSTKTLCSQTYRLKTTWLFRIRNYCRTVLKAPNSFRRVLRMMHVFCAWPPSHRLRSCSCVE